MKRRILLWIVGPLLVMIAVFAALMMVTEPAHAATDVVFEYVHQSNGHTKLYVHALSDSVVGVFWGVGDTSPTLRRISTPYMPTNWTSPLDEHTPPQYVSSCAPEARLCGSCERDYTWIHRYPGLSEGYYFKYEGVVAEWSVPVLSSSGWPNAQATIQTSLPQYPGGLRSGTCVVEFTGYTYQCPECAPYCDELSEKPTATPSQWSTVKGLYGKP